MRLQSFGPSVAELILLTIQRACAHVRGSTRVVEMMRTLIRNAARISPMKRRSANILRLNRCSRNSKTPTSQYIIDPFALSDASRHVTGTVMTIDDGQSL